VNGLTTAAAAACFLLPAVVASAGTIPFWLSESAGSPAPLVVIPAGCLGPPTASPWAALSGAAAPRSVGSSERCRCAPCAPLPLLSGALLATAEACAAVAEPLAWAEGAGQPSIVADLDPTTSRALAGYFQPTKRHGKALWRGSATLRVIRQHQRGMKGTSNVLAHERLGSGGRLRRHCSTSHDCSELRGAKLRGGWFPKTRARGATGNASMALGSN